MRDVRKILVTGNMGYIGPTVVRRLRDTWPAATIMGLDNGYFAHCLTGGDFLPETGCNMQYFADVRHVGAEVMQGVDAVIHLAAISNDPMGNAFEQVTREVNYEASARLANMAKAAGVRAFVFASSCSVYGYAEGEARSEQSELNPLTAYARSKIATEQNIRELADENFVITSLRFPTACGMSERLRLDLVLNDFVASAIATGTIKILSDGTPWRPLIDIKDMARAMEWAVDREPANGGAFLAVNVGRNEWNFQIRDLALAVQAQIPGVAIVINPDAPPDKRSYRVDFSLYQRLAADHLPQVPIEQSIGELKAGLEQMGFNNGNFRNSQYMRLRVLADLRARGRLDEALNWRLENRLAV